MQLGVFAVSNVIQLGIGGIIVGIGIGRVFIGCHIVWFRRVILTVAPVFVVLDGLDYGCLLGYRSRDSLCFLCLGLRSSSCPLRLLGVDASYVADFKPLLRMPSIML